MSGIIRVTPAELRDMSGRYTNESGQVQELVSRLDTMKINFKICGKVLQAKRLLLNTKN